MILFLEYSAGGKRGGELFTGHLHTFLKKTYAEIVPLDYVIKPVRLNNPLNAAISSLKLARLHRPKLVVADVSSGIRNLLAVRWVRRHGGKALIIVQDQRMQYRFANLFLIRWLVHRAERYLMRNADAIVVNSEFIASFARKWTRPTTPIVISHPGFELTTNNNYQAEPGDLSDTLHLLSPGPPSERKGTRYLIAAMGELKDMKVKLHITGDFSIADPYCREAADQVESLGLKDKVIFHGYVSKDEMEKLYCESRLFVLASLSEGYGIAMAEALAHGMPVVATRVAAIPEMIKDGVNGILVAPRNPVALASGVRALLQDRNRWENIRQANLAKARKLPSWDDFNMALMQGLAPVIRQLTGMTPSQK